MQTQMLSTHKEDKLRLIGDKPSWVNQIIVCIALVLAGCATRGSVENEPLSAGATRRFNSTFKSTIDAARASVAEVGLKLKSEKQTDGGTVLMAERGATGWSWGEIVRILVQPTSSGTSVRVLTERVFTPNVTATDFAEDLFTRIGQRLGDYP
ncbi:MAG TPA: hypothetical protein VFW23_11435 [Tepidisphaeraceae bacterium]|nr:hypothetical protein [Tepidisphaeraceae bacterium]